MAIFSLRPGRNVLLRSAAALIFLALGALSATAQDAGRTLAFQHAAHLQRGINLSNWFAQQPGNYSVARLQSYIPPADLELIRALGFDHVRLSLDADPLVAWQHSRPEGLAFMGEIDRVVRTANADGLAVIVDIHPESRYKQALLTGTEPVAHFAELWRTLAQHFRETDPALVFFEIMNEPEQTDTFRWQGIEAAVAEAIHQRAPQHTVIAAGARWSGLPDLLQMEPIADPNVIYTFHDYEPFTFTHQGATWTDPREAPLRDVPYPSTPENVMPNEAQEPAADGRFYVRQYGLDRWGPERVDATLAFAATWGTEHHVPVYCGEFGVHKPFAPPVARAAWLRDMRVSFEKI